MKVKRGRTDFDDVVEPHYLFPPLSKLFFGESHICSETRPSGGAAAFVIVIALPENAPAHEFGGGRAHVVRLEDFDFKAFGEMR